MANLDEVIGRLKIGLHVPAVVKKYLGDAGEEEAVRQSGGIYKNPEATAYVNAIGQKLAQASPEPGYGYRFGIVNDQGANAFALPNGDIFVTVGLLRLLRNEAQLANVIGHEISHVTAEHSVNQMAFNAGAIGVAEFLTRIGRSLIGRKAVSNDDRKTASALTLGVLANGYSRENEREADELGQALASGAGWDPSGMVDVMTIFTTIAGDSSKGLERYLQDHPMPKERLADAQKRSAALPRGDVGADRYAQFLGLLGLGPSEISKSSIEAAPGWLGRPGAGLLAPGDVRIGTYIGIGAVVIGAGILAWMIFRRD